MIWICIAERRYNSLIYIVTKAYNAEKTIRRTIESVISQTFGDFTYYVCNNGSLDGTEEIIQEYAEKDKRVVLIRQYPNCLTSYGTVCGSEMKKYIYRIMFNIEERDWYSLLDADDDLKPTFFEDLLLFAKQENLDYVACRSDFIKEPENIICNEHILEKDIVMKTKDDFDKLFPDYFRYMGAGWGKLQKGSIFHKFERSYYGNWLLEKNLSSRSDTAAQFFYLYYSERAGVKAKALHNYHLYPKGTSISNANLEGKIEDNYKMPAIYRDFLTKKVGYVSAENEQFIQEVFERSQRRTYEEMNKS